MRVRIPIWSCVLVIAILGQGCATNVKSKRLVEVHQGKGTEVQKGSPLLKQTAWDSGSPDLLVIIEQPSIITYDQQKDYEVVTEVKRLNPAAAFIGYPLATAFLCGIPPIVDICTGGSCFKAMCIKENTVTKHVMETSPGEGDREERLIPVSGLPVKIQSLTTNLVEAAGITDTNGVSHLKLVSSLESSQKLQPTLLTVSAEWDQKWHQLGWADLTSEHISQIVDLYKTKNSAAPGTP